MASLISQCFNRVHRRCFVGRIEAEEQPDDEREQERVDHSVGADDGRPPDHGQQQPGDGDLRSYAKQPPDRRHHNRFD